MESLKIWYFTDDPEGYGLSEEINNYGFNISIENISSLSTISINTQIPNIFIFNFYNIELDELFKYIKNEVKLQKFAKFAILEAEDIEMGVSSTLDVMNLEVITRPAENREFFLIIEKTLVVEKYRETMKNISQDAEDRIEAYESLVNIRKRDIFEDPAEKAAFNKIINFEHRVLEEQNKLNNAIKEFAHQRNREIFEIKNRLHAEEMLDHLRYKELHDAHETIRAQESVLSYSSEQLSTASSIIEANERAAEFSRLEAIRLHEQIVELEKENHKLKLENQKLKDS